jgi:hypothetical protein
MEKRTQKSIMNDLVNCHFTSTPNDIMTIKHSSGIISDTIAINLSNADTQEDIDFCVINKLDAWKWLKAINDCPARKVLYQVDKHTPVPFEESAPYKHRFNA